MQNQPTTLTVNEAALLLRVHPVTIRRWVAAGHLPFYRAGRGAIRISRAEVERLLAGGQPDERPAA